MLQLVLLTQHRDSVLHPTESPLFASQRDSHTNLRMPLLHTSETPTYTSDTTHYSPQISPYTPRLVPTEVTEISRYSLEFLPWTPQRFFLLSSRTLPSHLSEFFLLNLGTSNYHFCGTSLQNWDRIPTLSKLPPKLLIVSWTHQRVIPIYLSGHSQCTSENLNYKSQSAFPIHLRDS